MTPFQLAGAKYTDAQEAWDILKDFFIVKYTQISNPPFESIEAFLKWYNNRIHGVLDYFNAETPQEAFLRRAQPEAIFGRFLKWGDWYEKK